TILVVDEAILALAGHSFESPIKSFYKPNAAGVSDLSSRDYVLLANPEFNRADGREKPHPRGMGRKSKIGKRTKVYTFDDALVPAATALASDEPLAEAVAQRGKTTVRHRFDALALFAGSIPTDETGQAQVSVSMPDSLTRYRIVAYAVSSPNQFGLAESTITVRQPLMVRPSPPRFLNFGDKAHFPVVIQNLTDKDLSTHVALDVRNLKITGPAGHVVTVPAKDRIEVLFAIDTVSPGKAAYQVVTAAGPHSDAQTGQFPVWTPATTEAFATYGVIDSGHSVHQLKLPTDIIGQYGGLKVSTSSTALQELTDAFIYLVNYRFSCSEQIASRILSIAAMKDVLGAFNTDTLPSADTLAVTMATNFKWLASRQAADGGIPFWRPGGRTWPFLTVHVAHAVAMAQTKGYQVPSTLRKKLLRYLSRIDAHMPSQYKAQTRQVIKSYALYVLHLLGRNTVADSDMLITSIGLDKLPLTSLGFLLPILSRDDATASQRKRIVNYLYGKLSETAGRANFVSSTSDSDYLTLHSKRRLDAILLNALIASEPTSDAIPKLVRGLLSQRTRGRWGNTQENVFVLLALDRYFQAYEKSGPNFVAKVWVGDGLAGKHTFNTRSAVTENVAVPMDYLHRLSGVQPITLTKKGTGRLYYRLALNYAPKNLSLGPVNHGFVVSRRYEPMDHPDDVRLANDGTWRIKAGSRVRVRLSMFAKSRRYHVALVDPLPGGLETTNLALDGQSKSQQHESSIERIHGGWRRTWYAHQNLRDERVEAFTSMLWAGGYEYTYVARATTPGQFIAAPPKAEEMYNPETYGRGQTDRVIIE
ncbi:MAG: hypothetical protein CMH52_06725, partial [Myxococcales bacterium]|nr:hypothetical protein [Myxococcales bacterium]